MKSHEPSRTAGAVVRVLLVASLWLWAAAAFGLARRWTSYFDTGDAAERVVFVTRCLALLAGGMALAYGLRRGAPARAVGWTAVRRFAYCPLAALLLTSLAHDLAGLDHTLFLVKSFFRSALVLCTAAWGLWILRPASAPATSRRRWLVWADIACMNVMVFLLLGELALETWSRLRPSPLLMSGSSFAQRMESLRLRPGKVRFGFPANTGGYYDDEFIRAGPDDLVVAVLADSFGMGTVTHDLNFVTVAEQIVRHDVGQRHARVAFHNFGIAGIGMKAYAYLLETEVLQIRPRRVVLSIFVGNDIHEDEQLGGPARRDRRCLQNWLVWSVPRRLWIVARDADSPPEPSARPDAGSAPGNAHKAQTSPRRISAEAFRRIESRRLEVCNRESRKIDADYEAFFSGLAHFKSRLGHKLFVLVIPDEFQVNDALYREILATRDSPEHYARELPQERIGAYCREQGIAFLDLLPLMREAEKQERTYLPLDTHFNAHGNHIAGVALAEALRSDLESTR